MDLALEHVRHCQVQASGLDEFKVQASGLDLVQRPGQRPGPTTAVDKLGRVRNILGAPNSGGISFAGNAARAHCSSLDAAYDRLPSASLQALTCTFFVDIGTLPGNKRCPGVATRSVGFRFLLLLRDPTDEHENCDGRDSIR